MIGAALLDVPVDPNAADAQQLLLRELAKAEYAASQPTWFDRGATAVHDWFASLSAPSIPGFNLGLPLLLGLVAAAIVVLFLVFGAPKRGRRSRVTGALFGEDDARTSADMLASARAAAAAGDHSLAIAEGFRSIARGLAERELVSVTPGTTARGFSLSAGTLFESQAERLGAAASVFDGVRYLGATGTLADWRAIDALARELAAARAPARPHPSPVTTA